MADRIRILLADDHTIVREGLRALLATELDLEVVGEAADGIAAVEQARALRPDVILLDLLMPRQGGLEAIAAIKAEDPAARILVLTSFAEDEKLFPAIKAGALGYLLKDASPQELIAAIRDVARGEVSLPPEIARRVMSELAQAPDVPPTDLLPADVLPANGRPAETPPAAVPLTDREVKVLSLVAQGLSNQEIAEQLVVSERTVRTHVSNILNKLHLANRTQATIYALREGLARPPSK